MGKALPVPHREEREGAIAVLGDGIEELIPTKAKTALASLFILAL